MSLTGQWQFSCGSSKSVIDWSITVCKSPQSKFLETLLNCHWSVNDTFHKGVQKVSLTGQWHFSRKCSKSIIYLSMTLSKSPQSNFLETYQNYHWPGWRFKKQGKRQKFMTIASTFFSAIIVSQYPTFPLQISRLFSEAVIGKFSKYDEASTPYLGTLLMFQWSLACIVFNNSFSSSTTPCI